MPDETKEKKMPGERFAVQDETEFKWIDGPKQTNDPKKPTPPSRDPVEGSGTGG